MLPLSYHYTKKIFVLKYLILSTLLFSCKSEFEKRNNEINRIVFATGGCYGSCPIQVIDIESSLSYKYQGLANSNYIGFYEGNITQGFWDTLNIKLENINYKDLDSIYDHSVDDLSTEVYIYYNNGVKHIDAQSSSLPEDVFNVYNWFLMSIKNLKMNPTNKEFTFETITEKPIPIPDFSNTDNKNNPF